MCENFFHYTGQDFNGLYSLLIPCSVWIWYFLYLGTMFQQLRIIEQNENIGSLFMNHKEIIFFSLLTHKSHLSWSDAF